MFTAKLFEGIVYDPSEDTYAISFDSDGENDLVKLNEPDIHETSLLGNPYWFGYTFYDKSSKSRTRFIKWLKGLCNSKPTEGFYREFIARPMNLLDRKIGLRNIDLFMYPTSGRSNLVQKMIDVCGFMTQRDMKRVSVDVVKRMPDEVTFDWERFYTDYDVDAHAKEQIMDYVNSVLLPKIRSSEYFSLSEIVKPKYRKYISNYLTIESEDNKKFDAIKNAENILVVDDINTTGSTLYELLSIIKKFNENANIYIFTLIGNSGDMTLWIRLVRNMNPR